MPVKPLLAVLLAIGAAGWLVGSRRRRAGAKRDLAAVLVSLSARWLASTRPDWGRAMAAELEYLEGRLTRLRFALGCARAALVAPVANPRPVWPERAVVAVVAVAVVAMATLATRRMAAALVLGSRSPFDEVSTPLVFVLVGLQAWLTSRWARQSSAGAAAARRWGIPAGVIIGVLLLLALVPLPGASVLHSPPVGVAILVVPGGCLLAGMAAARASRDRASGREAGVWAGLVAAYLAAIGLLAATLWATGWFVHDPAMVSAFRYSLSPAGYPGYGTHYRTIAGFVVSDNTDGLAATAVWYPLMGMVFGAIGGALARTRREGDPARRRRPRDASAGSAGQ